MTLFLVVLFLVFRYRKTYTLWSPKSSYFLISVKSSEFRVKSVGFHEIQQISCRFHVDFMKFTSKPYKSNNSRKTLQFHVLQWEGYVSGFHMKFAGFHEIRNERPTIARNGKAYVWSLDYIVRISLMLWIRWTLRYQLRNSLFLISQINLQKKSFVVKD